MDEKWTSTLTIRDFDTLEDRALSYTSTRRGAGNWMTRQCNKFSQEFHAGGRENVVATNFEPVAES